MPGGDGTHRETTIDRLTFGADGLMQKVVPTLESIEPLAFEGTRPTAAVSDAGSDGWYGADAALTLTAGDAAEPVQYRIGDRRVDGVHRAGRAAGRVVRRRATAPGAPTCSGARAGRSRSRSTPPCRW